MWFDGFRSATRPDGPLSPLDVEGIRQGTDRICGPSAAVTPSATLFAGISGRATTSGEGPFARLAPKAADASTAPKRSAGG